MQEQQGKGKGKDAAEEEEPKANAAEGAAENEEEGGVQKKPKLQRKLSPWLSTFMATNASQGGTHEILLPDIEPLNATYLRQFSEDFKAKGGDASPSSATAAAAGTLANGQGEEQKQGEQTPRKEEQEEEESEDEEGGIEDSDDDDWEARVVAEHAAKQEKDQQQRKARGDGRPSHSGRKRTEERYFHSNLGVSEQWQKCSRCGRLGHDVRECNEPEPCYLCAGTDHLANACPNMTCYHCGELGHRARECRNRRRQRLVYCHRCGASDHPRDRCPVEFRDLSQVPGARCAVCGEIGHLMCNTLNKVARKVLPEASMRALDEARAAAQVYDVIQCSNCGLDHENEACGEPTVEAYHQGPHLIEQFLATISSRGRGGGGGRNRGGGGGRASEGGGRRIFSGSRHDMSGGTAKRRHSTGNMGRQHGRERDRNRDHGRGSHGGHHHNHHHQHQHRHRGGSSASNSGSRQGRDRHRSDHRNDRGRSHSRSHSHHRRDGRDGGGRRVVTR